MTPKKKKEPDKIIRVAGHEFHLYRYYDESSGEYMLNYPYFPENPEYAADGRPFAMAVQEGCQNGKSEDPDESQPYSCGECVWLHLESPYDPIGVCMCDALRREQI